MWESDMHFARWHSMSCFWAGGFSGTFSAQQHRRPSPFFFFFKELHVQSPLVSGHFCKWDADDFHVLPTGVREEAMGWTMTLKDDFGVIAWTRRAGSNLSLVLLVSLFSFSVQSDIVFPKDHHFSWRAGKMFNYSSLLYISFAFWLFKLKCQMCFISGEKSLDVVSSVLWNIFIFHSSVRIQQDGPLWTCYGSHTRAHFSTLIIFTRQSQSLLLLIIGEKYDTSTFILSECSFVGKSNPPLSDTQRWEHKPRAAIGHHQARGPLHLCI